MKKKTLKKAERQPISLTLADPNATPVDALEELGKEPKGPSPLIKSIINVLNDPKDKVERLAFETDPSVTNQYSAVFRAKLKLLPDFLLKKIAIQDDLVAAILNARANQMSAFGRPQRDRFAMGFKIELNDEIKDSLNDDQKKLVQKRIDAASKLLQNCGHTNGWGNDDQLSFSQYLYMIVRNGLTVGRFATEVIRTLNAQTGRLEFHSFRPIDAGTLYRATPQKDAAQQVRDQARMILEQLKNKKLEPDRFEHDEYSWIQVIENTVRQAFTPEECLVHNLYPVTDIELDGYPLTPLDTVINAVTTHINITTHNKLYFQAGRAARGMLVIKSEDIDDAIVNKLRQQFNASINSVNNAWRMPVFGIGEKDEVTWQPIDGSSRDMEFQYLSDNNARVILSAFQMSPEELPGYAHLSRGTNNQALSESNSEYKLEAHRDLGIRPLISQIEDFLNKRLFPLIDPNLAKLCSIHLKGLDADTAEKESVRLQQDMPVHMTYDDVLQKVEKTPLGPEWAGTFPLNPQWQAILDKYFFVGEIMEYFFHKKGAAENPAFQYMRDPFFFQWAQFQMQQQQLKMQQQQMQQQQQAQQQQAQQQQAQQQQEEQPQDTELTQGIDQAQQALGKSEKKLNPTKRRLIAQQAKMVDHIMDNWAKDCEESIKEIIDIADVHLPTKYKS